MVLRLSTAMKDRKAAYRALYEQSFVPIFVFDRMNTDVLLEGCRLAGIKWIEYTLRRQDANKVIPTLKERYPEFWFTVGSTLDSEKVVKKLSEKYPQLMTFQEIADTGADGFVSMLPMSSETIRKYASDHIMVPGAETMGEALRQVDAGAQFIKILGTRLDLVRSLNAAPAFKFCPIFVTGGVKPETMPQVYEAGAVLTAAGFDLILKDYAPEEVTPELVAEQINLFVAASKKARAEAIPQLAGLEELSDEEFFARLPNYAPF